MKIIKVDCWLRELAIREPYTIAYETISKCENLFLRAETDAGIVGWGCAAPDLPVTGETGQTVLKAFTEVIEPILKGSDPFRYANLTEELNKHLEKQPSALAMADMVLYDLMSKKAGEPLYKFLGGYRDHIATSITVGILPVKETVAKAVQLINDGFQILKVKCGG